MKIQAVKCGDCGTLLGYTDGDGVLYLGGIALVSADFFCTHCGHRELWYPSPKLKLDSLLEQARAFREWANSC